MVDYVDELLLLVESFNYYGNKKIYEQQAENNDDKDVKNDESWFIAFYRLHILSNSIYRVPHERYPSFTGLGDEERKHALQCVIVVHVRFHPLTSYVQTIPLCFQKFIHKFNWQITFLR